jgi:hypothetical protein
VATPAAPQNLEWDAVYRAINYGDACGDGAVKQIV